MTIDQAVSYPFADVDLARRLERCEATANSRFVDARAREQPEVGACWIDVDGAFAMFDGPASPVTQTFGLGMFTTPAAGQLEVIERFFRDRGAAVNHETSPLADAALVPLLAARHYRPIEYSSVLYRPAALPTAMVPDDAIRIVALGPDEGERFARTAGEGWGFESAELEQFVRRAAGVHAAASGFHCFVAQREGRDIAAGALFVHDRMALLAGASTIPSGRRQGAQFALLNARLRFAVEAGCDLAMMAALPGSASQRNAERHGFRVAYTRVKWQLPA